MAQEISYPINIDDVEWDETPKDWYMRPVKWKVLWKNDVTDAMFVLLKVPKGEGALELPHRHPQANQMGFILSGELELPNGTRRTFGDGRYNFRYSPQALQHGPKKGATMKLTQDVVVLQYFDGPVTKLNEGETKAITLE